MSDDSSSKETNAIATRVNSTTPTIDAKDVLITSGLNINPSFIPLDGLSDQQKQALKMKQAELALAADQKAKDAAIGLGVLSRRLSETSDTAHRNNQNGLAVTATATHKDAFGGVDILIGNTQEAINGKVPRVATANHTEMFFQTALKIAVIAGVAAVIIAALGK